MSGPILRFLRFQFKIKAQKQITMFLKHILNTNKNTLNNKKKSINKCANANRI